MVSYALGSGTRGVSYLVERDGRLFQSPISWYGQKRRWDISPGYEIENPHFDRPIEPGCLFCHANRAEPVEHTVNRYAEPIFRGHSVGCERCHGPGELDVRRPEWAEGRDQDLETAFRESSEALRIDPGSWPRNGKGVCERPSIMGFAPTGADRVEPEVGSPSPLRRGQRAARPADDPDAPYPAHHSGAMSLDPFLRFARMFLVQSELHLHEPGRAREEFATLVGLFPSLRAGLERWFAERLLQAGE